MSTTTTTRTTAIAAAAVLDTDTDKPDYIPRGPVSAELSFFSRPADGSVPYSYVEEPPAGQPRSNFQLTSHKVTLDDIRGHEQEYNLDKDAFQVYSGVSSATTYETFNEDEQVKKLYYPEVEQFLLGNVPGAHKVILFDHTIRRQDPNAHRQPVNSAHSDQTDRATEWRVRLHVEDKDEAETLLKGRYRIINVWRPINGAVQAAPLAVASAASVDESKDLVAVERRAPDRTGETMGVIYNPTVQWKYWSGIDNDERILLKCADSQPGVGKRCPHTAFVDPRTPKGAKPRESIEVRALVFG
ncbi:hypothetical protein UA08_01529 [Talaromyces atroroseus]|uniref:Methyltransferase n=1 Tax=Talaromyces atroroseus TaxID=1441469 RepID=A0A1Q5QAT2_TALAT|nr:hypothetical protein UA08_01529 [Talaromyces atroroseus]OKL62879.1 hypothetical protein UA08_01529 [Talaromyces atroroseus]